MMMLPRLTVFIFSWWLLQVSDCLWIIGPDGNVFKAVGPNSNQDSFQLLAHAQLPSISFARLFEVPGWNNQIVIYTVRDWSYKFTNPTRTKASATPTKGSTTATETAEGEVDAKAWFGTNASIASILSTPSGLVGNCSTEFAIAIHIDSCREMSVKNTCHIMPLSVSCSQLQVSAQFMIAEWGWRSLKASLRTSSEFFLSCPSAGKYALPQWSGDRTFMRLTVLVGLAICCIVSFVTLEQLLSMMSDEY